MEDVGGGKMRGVYITDRFHIKMLPYVEGTLKVGKASIIDVKRAMKKGAEVYIYKEENADLLTRFTGIEVNTTTEPLIVSRDEKPVIYVITTLKTTDGSKKFVWRLEYEAKN